MVRDMLSFMPGVLSACPRRTPATSDMAPNSVRLTVRWRVTPVEARRITESLHRLMEAARVEPGYVNCSLSTELGATAQLYYREEWGTERDLQNQIRSSRFAQLTELIEHASQEPLVQIHLPAQTRGREYFMEQLLKGKDNERH